MVIPRLVASSITSILRQQLNKSGRKDAYRLISTCRHLCAERKFTEKHEWVEVKGNTGIVGISKYAQESLGDVVYAQLPDVGTDLGRGEECGTLESVKAASEIYSPISGKVLEKNATVEDTPSLINTSCYDKGWLYKVDLKDSAELKDLMTEEQYNEFLKSDDHH